MKKLLLFASLLSVGSAHAQFPNAGWVSKTPLPDGRAGTGTATYQVTPSDARIVLVGGWNPAFTIQNTVLQFNSTTSLWSTVLPAVPTGRIHARPMYHNNKVYYIGGYIAGFTPTNAVNIFDVTTNTWSLGANMLQGVGDYASAQYGDYIYIISGYSGSADVTTVQVYNTATNAWSLCTPLAGTPTGGARAGIAKGKIVVVGGYSQVLAGEISQARLGTIDPTNPALITWTVLPNYPGGTLGRHAAGSVKSPLGTAVYFTAGDPNGAGNTALSATWAYDVVAGQWQPGPNKPTAVSNVVSLDPIVVNDSLFFACVGGYSGASIQTANEWLKIGRASGISTTISGNPVKCFNTADTIIANNLDTNLRWQTSANNVNFSFITTPNGTNDTLFTGNLTTNTYFRAVSYGYVDSAISPSFLVTILDTISITNQPTSQAVCSGTNATFSVTATGAGAAYSWRKNGSPLSNTPPFSGVNTNTLTISDVTGQQGIYDVVVTGTCNIKTSTPAVLTVNALPTETITALDTLVCDGASTVITINFTGMPPYNFTYFNGTTPINNPNYPLTTFSYTVTPTSQTTYYVSSIIDGNGCSAAPAGLSSTVTVYPKSSPVITWDPLESTCRHASLSIL